MIIPQIAYPIMEDQLKGVVSPSSQVKATFCLGLEKYNVCGAGGVLSGQLASMKQESMMILKDFITKHNVPTDVPDESVESFSEDDTEVLEKLPERTKKRK